MSQTTFRAFVSREQPGGPNSWTIENKTVDELPPGDVVIAVEWAGVNYKDALSARDHKGITRNYPHTPGVDAAGKVVSDMSGTFKEGQQVLVTGYDLGMNTAGGFGERIRVPKHWVVPVPQGLTTRQAMIMGTGAFTAALAVHKMQKCGQHPDMGEVVITGATGGVGSMAIALLARLGYRVAVSTGKPELTEYLRELGASTFLSREDLNDTSGKLLLKPRWAGAIDTVGGNTLATLLKGCARNGCVAVCGLVASPELQTTVYPFILNGVNMLGVDSAETPRHLREELWRKLSGEWSILPALEKTAREVSLEELGGYLNEMLKGESKGRVIVRHR